MQDEFEEEPAVILGSTVRSQTMADSSLRIVIDVSPADMQAAFRLFGSPGTGVALARMMDSVMVEHERPKADGDNHPRKDKVDKTWGQEARTLFQSSFFRNPDVWRAIGTDKEYLEWVKRQPSAISGEFSEHHDTGEQYCIPAHVRRVEHGAGTSIKPPYAAIPLTNSEHQQTHNHGDTSLRPDEWWDKTRIKYVHQWCWETAKTQITSDISGHHLPFESFGMIPPILVEGWAMQRKIERHLPNVYKGHVNGETEIHPEANDS